MVNTQELRIERTLSDRVHFLTTDEYTRTVKFGEAAFGVILWTDNKDDQRPITLKADCGPLGIHQPLTPANARLIAMALLAAANETESMADPLDQAIVENGGAFTI